MFFTGLACSFRLKEGTYEDVSSAKPDDHQAQQKQFALVDSICRHFPGSEFLTGGDLGLTPGLNQPRVTQRVEQVLADAFHAQAAALVQGAGTGAIGAGLRLCSNRAASSGA